MKSFKTFLTEKSLDVKTPTPEQAAKKGGVSVKELNKQLKAGIRVEKEHTTKTKVAREIALDHLGERPDYYKRLKKVESYSIMESGKTIDSHTTSSGDRFERRVHAQGEKHEWHTIVKTHKEGVEIKPASGSGVSTRSVGSKKHIDGAWKMIKARK